MAWAATMMAMADSSMGEREEEDDARAMTKLIGGVSGPHVSESGREKRDNVTGMERD